MGEAVVKAAAPGANITAIMVSMESKYRMVVAAFNNTSLYRKLYWAGLGYTPTASRNGRSVWTDTHTAGEPRWLAALSEWELVVFVSLQVCPAVPHAGKGAASSFVSEIAKQCRVLTTATCTPERWRGHCGRVRAGIRCLNSEQQRT
jgi:hypothetical protein